MYQEGQLEKLISDYKPIVLDSLNSRDQNFELECSWNQEGCGP